MRKKNHAKRWKWKWLNSERRLRSLKHKSSFKNCLVILDEILDCQRSLFDKFGLGYNNAEKYKVGTWTPKRHESSPSFSKGESKAPAQNRESMKRSEQGRHQEASPLLKVDSEERHLQDRTKIDMHVG